MKTSKSILSCVLVLALLVHFSSCKKDPCADGKCTSFQGCVVDQDGNPIAGADVEIRNFKTKTDEKGCYLLNFDEETAEGDYVINIRKEKFGPLSEIAFGQGKGMQHVLYPASVFEVDPTQPIDITDSESSNRRGSFSAQSIWKGHPFTNVPMVYNDGKLVDLDFSPAFQEALKYSKDRKKAGSGIRVTIPANSIEVNGGGAPTGKVKISLSTIDLFSVGAMPGDYSIQSRDNERGPFMVSYGAGSVEIYDAKDRYNLKKGTKATITIPVDPAHLALKDSIPETIPLFYHDDKTGKWIEEGVAKLNASKDAYTGEVGHFSTFNMDIKKTNPACFSFRYNSVGASTFPSYKIEVMVPFNNTIIHRQKVVTDQGNYPDKCLQNGNDTGLHMLYNLPENTEVAMIMFDMSNNPINILVGKTGTTYGTTRPSCATPDCASCNPTLDQCDEDPGPCTAAYAGCKRHSFHAPAGEFLVAAQAVTSTSVKIKWVYTGAVASPSFTVWTADDSAGMCADVAAQAAAVTSQPLSTNPSIKVYEATVTGLAAGSTYWFKVKENTGGVSLCSDPVAL